MLAGLAALVPAPAGAADAAGRDVFFNIATGSTAGTYFPVGQLIASVISHPQGAVRCAEAAERCGPEGLIAVAQASQGSVANLRQVLAGRVVSALAQADILHDAAAGTGPFAGAGPNADFLAIARLYVEDLHLVAAPEAGIRSLADLKGKRVSVDREASGTHANAFLVLKAAGLSERNVTLSFTDADQNAERILFGEIDAYFLMAGAPVRSIRELTLLGLAELVPVGGRGVDALVARTPYLWPHRIAAGTYPGQDRIETLSVGAVWLVHKDVDADLVYAITRAFWHPENRPLLEGGHPKGAQIRLETARLGVPVPFHPGAERYYREVGMTGPERLRPQGPFPRPKPQERAANGI